MRCLGPGGAQQSLRHLAREEGLVTRHRVHRRDQEPPGIGLEQITPCPCLEEFVDESLVVVHRKDEHLGLRMHCPDLPRHIRAVEKGKLVVEDGDIRLRHGRELDRLLAILGLGDHLPTWLAAQNGVETGADNVMIIRDQDAGHREGIPPGEPHASSRNSAAKIR